MTWPNVLGFVDEENVTSDTLNRPVRQLTQRTDWLYSRLAEIGDGIQSVRLTDVLLTMDTDAEPEVGDFVYLDPELRSFSKALASVEVASTVFQTAKNQAYSMGLLIAKVGNLGTVAVLGKTNLSDTNSDWALSMLLETGETFRSGPYYLSSVTAGKMTAYPKNVAIYLGFFVDDADTPAVGGYALMSPQYKDVGEAHLHRAFALAAQPAGTWDAYGVYGFTPKSADVTYHGTATATGTTVLTDTLAFFAMDNYIGCTIHNVTAEGDSGRVGTNSSVIVSNDTTTITTGDDLDWQIDDEYYIEPRCRLVLLGNYTGADVTYTLSLTDDTGVAGIGAGYPVNGTGGFENVYLKWVSSDTEEGDGLVQLVGYEIPVPVGTKGLSAVLENVLTTGWGYAEADASTLDRRQWVIEAPTQIVGWRARKFRQFFSKTVSVDGGFSLQLLGGPFTNTPEELNTDINVVMGNLYKIVWSTAPVDGDTITIGATVYEFDTDSSVSSGNIAVAISGLSAADSYAALLAAILGQNVTGTTAAIDLTNTTFAICLVPISQTVALSGGYTGGVLTQVSTGATNAMGSSAVLLVYDSAYNTLVPTVTFWSDPAYYVPVTLTNALQVMFIPFLSDGTPKTGDALTAGDLWATTVTDEAPNAELQYAVDCDQAVRPYYPPTPVWACALTGQGEEMPNSALYPLNGVYRSAFGGLYWNAQSTEQPWAADWVSIASPGTAFYVTLYLAHMRLSTTSVVTSLQPAAGSPIKVLRCGTNTAATVGDLALDLDLDLVDDNANLAGWQVYKKTNGRKLLKGPVVSKIVAGPGISLSSSAGAPDGCGEVVISSSDAAFAGDFEEIALINAKQEMIGLFPYIRLLEWITGAGTNIETGFTAKFVVPITLEGTYQVAAYLTLFGESDTAGTGNRTHAGLTFNYNILRNFDPSDETFGTLVDNLIEYAVGGVADTIDVAVPMGIDGGTVYDGSPYVYKAFQPMVIHDNPSDTADEPGRIVRCLGSSLFPKIGDLKGGVVTTALSQVTVQAGSAVAIRVQRGPVDTGSYTEYTGKLGILRLRWQLIRVS